MNAVTERRASPAQEFRGQFEKMSGEISAALPPHIPVERFMRVVLTAVNSNPALLNADRRTLFEAAMKAAQDGLLPDGRDGAFVIFRTKDGNSWIEKVQWMPMVGGVLKKIRNSGELLSISAHVAYEHDEFTYALGDDERIEHKPTLGDRGKPRLVYAVAKTKDGGVYREIMTVAEIERVRQVSRAKDKGPWVDWWSEMARKTVIRRLAKRLPMSTDLDDLIRRDDDLYDMKGGDGAGQMNRLFRPVANPLSDTPPVIEHDGDGVIDETDTTSAASSPASDAQKAPADEVAGGAPAGAETPASDDDRGLGEDDDSFPGDVKPRRRS